ncbi:hypothetical protein EMCRGX_G010346 [Ephydatia muelleri]
MERRDYDVTKETYNMARSVVSPYSGSDYSDTSVEKHNDDAKRNYFSSNLWDAPADIMMTEYRLEVLQEYSREKRAYTKRDSA